MIPNDLLANRIVHFLEEYNLLCGETKQNLFNLILEALDKHYTEDLLAIRHYFKDLSNYDLELKKIYWELGNRI